MGRRIQLAATEADERSLLSFLRETGEIAVIESFAATPEELWKEAFEPLGPGRWTYYLWNRAFPWQPEYIRADRAPADSPNYGWYAVSNYAAGPVLQFSRSDVAARRYGRLYWAGPRAATRGLEYDPEAFAVWYERIVRWVRENGRRDPADRYSPYFLPEARQVHRRLGQPRVLAGETS